MLPVSSLLNPLKSEPRSLPKLSPSQCTSPYWSASSAYNSPDCPSHPSLTKQKMSKDGAVFSKGKIKGELKFPPFEKLDPKSLHEVQKHKVYPLGQIEAYCRHIPYNSEKKSFLEKTGRESFEVFQYEFKLPGEEKVYTVMWDYNIGLVRVTPFFKCCKYSKTTPAKMLNMNPGLKEITHSITGGALAAQGYWMPYSCALAVCATFCDHISGALIPIFGPNFPARCTPTTAANYARMIIDPAIISAATEEAEHFRNYYSSAAARTDFSSPSPSSGSPRERLRDVDTQSFLGPRGTPPPFGPRRLKRAFTGDSYNSDTDVSDSSGDRYVYSPVTPSPPAVSMNGRGWNAMNAPSLKNTPRSIPMGEFDEDAGGVGPRAVMSCVASPWLSAIPRPIEILSHNDIRGGWTGKRNQDDLDDGYDAGESEAESLKIKASESVRSKESDSTNVEDATTVEGIKKAALGLMNLCVYDPERNSPRGSPYVDVRTGEAFRCAAITEDDEEGPRRKRMRATSV